MFSSVSYGLLRTSLTDSEMKHADMSIGTKLSSFIWDYFSFSSLAFFVSEVIVEIQVSSGKDDCSPWEQQLPFTKDCIYFSGKNACKLFLRSLMPVLGILDEGSFFSRACFCDGDRRVASSPGLRTEMTQGLWRCPISFPKSVNLHPHPLLLPPCF